MQESQKDLKDSIHLGFQGLLTGFRRWVRTKDPQKM